MSTCSSTLTTCHGGQLPCPSAMAGEFRLWRIHKAIQPHFPHSWPSWEGRGRGRGASIGTGEEARSDLAQIRGGCDAGSACMVRLAMHVRFVPLSLLA